MPAVKKLCWADAGEPDVPEVGRTNKIGSPAGMIEEGEILDSLGFCNLRSDAGSVSRVGADCVTAARASVGASTRAEGVSGDHPTSGVKVEHMLSKIEVEVPKMPNGSIDLSNGFEMGIFYEAPPCLIRFPMGRCPSVAALRGLIVN
ncbi:hypothetical protein Dimus_015331 [Dionaea muscipula]